MKETGAPVMASMMRRVRRAWNSGCEPSSVATAVDDAGVVAVAAVVAVVGAASAVGW